MKHYIAGVNRNISYAKVEGKIKAAAEIIPQQDCWNKNIEFKAGSTWK